MEGVWFERLILIITIVLLSAYAIADDSTADEMSAVSLELSLKVDFLKSPNQPPYEVNYKDMIF